MGEKSVELLERWVRHMDDDTLEEVEPSETLAYELVERQSTGPCPYDRA
jgi:hypothetical protein